MLSYIQQNVDFLKKFLDSPKTSHVPDLGAKSWSAREFIAARFAEIDFGCGFKDGQCINQRKGFTDSKRACCSHCAAARGYLRTVNPKDREFYLANFDGDSGFWREGKGCILPHAKRSATCLSYRCLEASYNAPRAFLLPWLKTLAELPNMSGMHHATSVKSTSF